MRRALLLLILLLILPASAQDNVASLAQQAAAAYEAGDYAAAVDRYEALIDGGIRDGALYYNLGAAYLRTNDLGRALLNFRRAQTVIPRDPDLSQIIGRVRARRIDVQPESVDFIDNMGALTDDLLTVNELSWIVFSLWTMVFGLLLIRRLRPGWGDTLRLLTMVVALLLIVIGGLLAARLYITMIRPPAVVIAPTASVMSGPGDTYLEHFTLHSGAEIRVLERRDDWVRFSLPDGRQGWLPDSAFEPV